MLDDLKKVAWFRRPTIHENPAIMGFREGQRAVVVAIENMLELASGAPQAEEANDSE